MPKAHPLFLEIASQLRDLANAENVTWSFGYYINPETGLTHFEEELAGVQEEAGVDFGDVVYVCRNGKITDGDANVSPPRYRVEEFTTDDVHIGLGVNFNIEEKWIEFVTVFVIRQ